MCVCVCVCVCARVCVRKQNERPRAGAVKFQYSGLSDFNQIRSFATDSRKSPSIKFPENPSSGSRTDTCGQTDTEELKSGFLPFTVRRHLKKLCVHARARAHTHTHSF